MNMPSYEVVYRDHLARKPAPQSSTNPALLCCDIHPKDDSALRWITTDGAIGSMTFDELRVESCRFANWLRSVGVTRGDRVAVLLPRVRELVIALIGIMRVGAVYQPLFTAFGPDAIRDRLASSGAKLILTDAANRGKLDGLQGIAVVCTGGSAREGDVDFWEAIGNESSEFAAVSRDADDPMLLLFTSGTTGKPKGVEVPVRALESFMTYMRYAIDLRPSDVYWNIADPGWAYGLYYGVIGPLLLGNALTFYQGPFTAESTYDVIRRLRVTNLAGSPTAYRLLMARGNDLAAAIRGQLRVASSAGEALNPEVIRWFSETLGSPVHDHYGQTECGMVLANHHGLLHPILPGTAGRALPGVRTVILGEDDAELAAGEVGELAVDRDTSPQFWFRGYSMNAPQEAEPGRFHRTGDLGKADSEGTVTFFGRADDVITSSGYRIGPFDVESTLMQHPAVAEVAVVGKPDPIRTEIVKAFVVLRDGVLACDAMAEELGLYVKERLAAHAYPREFEFVGELPKTASGKVQRYLLRQKSVDAS